MPVTLWKGGDVWLGGIVGMARAVPRLLQHLHLQVRASVVGKALSVSAGSLGCCLCNCQPLHTAALPFVSACACSRS
jgi:hypothetical protein